MTIRVTAVNRLPSISRDLAARVSRVVKQTANAITASAKERMAEPKTGRFYGSHRASAPGEAPAIDTGNLAGSIEVEMDGPLTAVVTVGAEYGPFLEYGTAHIAPRPFLTPAVEEARPGFVEAVKQALIP